MVTRPSIPDLVPPPLSQATNNPPYPTSPNTDREKKEPMKDDDEDTGSDWDKDSDNEEPSVSGPSTLATEATQGHIEELPGTLRAGLAHVNPGALPAPPASQDALPETLRVGPKSLPPSFQPSDPIGQSLPQVSTHSTGSGGRKFSVNNPYLRKKLGSTDNEADGGNPLAHTTLVLPSNSPPRPPIRGPPDSTQLNPSGSIPPLEQEKDNNAARTLLDGYPEMRETPMEQQSRVSVSHSQYGTTGFTPIAQSNPWESEFTAEEKWCDDPDLEPQKGILENRIEHSLEDVKKAPPSLPPRKTSEEIPPLKPPGSVSAEGVSSNVLRPSIDTTTATTSTGLQAETPTTKSTRQRNEHYSIRHINWFDERSGRNPRRSPIIIQNANGPCPLLALVNALVLSTPPGTETALIETLRVREQVSLGLLLDAVFEELMSGRRGDAAHELPDVGDLYAFLITLHTGMNVNPRFVSPSNSEPNEKNQLAGCGAFEGTREMRLYSTFAIPLLHGWLPSAGSPEFTALCRSAPTYEDAQNIQFREEELEEKLRVSALSLEEQQVFEDVISIKEFLQTWPTQLTDCGLQAINESVRPGGMAILFRNDHFSTLYKEPRSNRLMTLVTDAGYSSHDEIVWESLVDINGRSSELYSGDFRPVGNLQEQAGPAAASNRTSQRQQSLLDSEGGWETVPSRHGKSSDTDNIVGVASAPETGNTTSDSPGNNELPSATSNTEQEDHDLALALQLQEEEEDAHRRSQAARRREDDLSRRYLSRESPTSPIPGQDSRPNVPPRRSGQGAPTQVRHTHRSRADGEEAPPSYEQAASDRPYIPGQQNSGSSSVERPRRLSAYAQQVATNSMGQGSRPLAPGQGGRGAGGLGPGSPISPRRRGPRIQSVAEQTPLGHSAAAPPIGRGGGRRPSGQQVPVGSEDRERCTVM